MYDQEIETLLAGSPITRPFFIGVFSPKDLPTRPPSLKRYCFVLSTTNRLLTHWIAVYIEDSSIASVFCSYGTHPFEIPRLKQFLAGMDEIRWNKKAHQKWNSQVCGGYCCYILYHLCLGKSFVKTISIFERIKRDDDYIKRFMYRVFSYRFQ